MHISLLWILVAGEVFMLVLVAFLSLLLMGMNRRRRDRQAAMYLVGVVKDGEGKRLDETRALLETKYGYSGEDLANTAHDIVQAEKLLYQRVINMYVKRDNISVRELNIDVEAATEPLRALEVAGAGPRPTVADSSVDNGDAEHLREENEALKQELQITMETMSRMLGEYATMFGGGPQTQEQSETMQQMLAEAKEGDLDDGFGNTSELATAIAGAESVDGLEELSDFTSDESQALDLDSPDATVVMKAETDLEALDDDMFTASLDDDLSLDEFDNTFDSAEAPAAKAAASEEEAPMDDELADIWADALAEQDESEKK